MEDRTEPTWRNQVWHALRLPMAELRQHAGVCTDNRCPCLKRPLGDPAGEGSFCCACRYVLKDRAAATKTAEEGGR